MGGLKCCSLAVPLCAGLQPVCESSSAVGKRLCRPSLILVAVLSCSLQWRNRQLKRAIKESDVRLGHWKFLWKGDCINCRVHPNAYWCPLHSNVGINADWRPWRSKAVMCFVSHHLSDNDCQAQWVWDAQCCTVAFRLKLEKWSHEVMAGHILFLTSSRNNKLLGANFLDFFAWLVRDSETAYK